MGVVVDRFGGVGVLRLRFVGMGVGHQALRAQRVDGSWGLHVDISPASHRLRRLARHQGPCCRHDSAADRGRQAAVLRSALPQPSWVAIGGGRQAVHSSRG